MFSAVVSLARCADHVGQAVQLFQHTAVNVLQRFQISHGHELVDFVDGGVGWAKFNDLWADLCDEATIAGAASGGQLGVKAGFIANGALYSAYQITGRGEEG